MKKSFFIRVLMVLTMIGSVWGINPSGSYADSAPAVELEPIYLTVSNGDLAINPLSGEMVSANLYMANTAGNPAASPISAVLEWKVYDSSQTLISQETTPVNQTTARAGYATAAFAYPAGGSITATLKDAVNPAVELAEPVVYPEPSDPSRNGEVRFPDDFANLPFTISKTGTRTYTHNATPQNQYDWSGATEIFLSTTVAVSGPGTSASAPITGTRFKTNFTNGEYGTQTKFIFTLLDNMYAGTTTENLIPIVSTGIDALVRSGSPDDFSWIGRVRRQGNSAEITANWTADGNVYKTVQVSAQPVTTLLNFQHTDRYGMPVPYVKVTSLADCQNTRGTFYQDTADAKIIYVNPFEGENLQDISLLLSQTLVEVGSMITGKTVMFENIGFLPDVMNSNNIITGGSLDTRFYFFNCKFYRGKHDAIALAGRYQAYLFDSIAAYASKDGFNYHAASTESSVVEVNGIAYGSGKYKLAGGNTTINSNNGSTAHDGMKVLRVGGRYWNTEGPIVADGGGCYVINMGIEAYNVLPTTTGERDAFLLHDVGSAVKRKKFVVDSVGSGANLKFGISGTAETYVTDYLGYQKYGNGDLGTPVAPIPLPYESIRNGTWTLPSPVDDHLTLYTGTPGAVASTAYTVTVNGQSVFVEKFKDISYARFAFSGTAHISVTASQPVVKSDISPHSYRIQPTVSGNSISFNVAQPRKLIVTLNDQEKLFIFADPLETDAPRLGDPGVYNVMDTPGVDNTGNTLNTVQLQAAIDQVAAQPGGGVLYVPDGKYLTGTLYMRSHVTLYLEDGALIQGTSNTADYPRPVPLRDGTSIKVGTLIAFDQATNAKITGRGVIDGDGLNLRNNGLDAWLILTMQSSHIVVEDVILRDPAAFNSHIAVSDYVTFQRVKLINDINNPNTDGIDPDSSRHVVIDDVFSYCSDDSVSVKSWVYTPIIRDSYDITVKNSVFWTRKSALKIGTETINYSTRDVYFINNDIVHADRALTIYNGDGNKVSNIQFINNRAEFVGGDSIRRLIHFQILPRYDSNYTPGYIEDIIIKDFFAEAFSENSSSFEGFDAAHKINNVIIDNLVVAGEKKTTLQDARITANAYVSNVRFTTAPAGFPYVGPEPYVPGNPFYENNGMVSFEAEHYAAKQAGSSSDWTLDTAKPGPVGDGMMVSASANGEVFASNFENTSPRLDYNVSFNTPGIYYVWVRTYSNDLNKRGFHVGLDGHASSSSANMEPYMPSDSMPGSYWTNKNSAGGYAQLDVAEAGLHTVNLWMKEAGVYIDKIVLLKAADGTVLPKYISVGRKGFGPFESVAPSGPAPVTIEAEDMTLSNYVVENNAVASNGKVIKANGTGVATFQHNGADGMYDLNIAYFDENDGVPSYKLYINNVLVDQWVADLTTGSASADAASLTSRLIANIPIPAGAQVKLEGTANLGDPARVDYIQLTYTGPLTEPLPDEEVFKASRGSPVVDGIQEGIWNSAETHPFTYFSKSGTDLSGAVKALWDESKLYFLFDVKDVTRSTSGSNEHKDSVELWLSFDRQSASGYTAPGDGHIRVSVDGEITSNFGNTDWVAQQAASETEDGYMIELAVNWKGTRNPAVGSLIGFTASVNDDSNGDGSRDMYMATSDKWYWDGTINLGVLKYLATQPDGSSISAALSGAASVHSGQSFPVTYSLSHVTQSVYAQDLTVNFDALQLRLDGVQSLRDGVAVIDSHEVAPGRVRILAHSQGEEYAVGESGDMLQFQFTALAESTVTSSVYLSEVKVSDGDGTVTPVNAGLPYNVVISSSAVDKNVLNSDLAAAQAALDEATAGSLWGQYSAGSISTFRAAVAAAQAVAADPLATQALVDQAVAGLNAARQIFADSANTIATVGDLGVLSRYYNQTSGASDWNLVKRYDFNRNDRIDITDLAAIARLILNY